MELPFLDQVIHESLRKNPPLTFSNRECSESITIEDRKGHKVLIEKGQRVFIPLLSFHHDPGHVLRSLYITIDFPLNPSFLEIERIAFINYVTSCIFYYAFSKN